MKKIILLFSIGGLCLCTCVCAQQNIHALLLDNQQKLTALSIQLKNSNKFALFQKSVSTSKLLGDFSARLEETESIASDYLGTLINYNQVLRKAAEIADSAEITKTLEYISNDIVLKFATGTGLTKVLSGTVTVTVKVIDANKELNGYDVSLRYNLALDETFTQKLNPTNDAHKDILPGWYLIRVSKNGAGVAERSEYVRVNSDNTFIFNIQP